MKLYKQDVKVVLKMCEKAIELGGQHKEENDLIRGGCLDLHEKLLLKYPRTELEDLALEVTRAALTPSQPK